MAERAYSIAAVRAAIEAQSARNLARIVPTRHYDPDNADRTAVGVNANASSRFSDPHLRYGVLYASPDVGTACWEAVIRDRYLEDRPTLSDLELSARTVAFFDANSLSLVRLDVRTMRTIKASRSAIGGDRHEEGQRLSAFVHDNAPEADGLMYRSTFTHAWCVAVFERATSKLQLVRAHELALQPEIDQLCAEYDIRRIE